MASEKKYEEDLRIAKQLIARDERTTCQYFYKQCYPLFKSIYDNYQTDCESCLEFISEIYVVVLAPSKQTGKCQMENFQGESSLAAWLKTACLYYCYRKYKSKQNMPVIGQLVNPDDEKFDDPDRFIDLGGSSNLDTGSMDRTDVETVLNMMPNPRYAKLIKLRYLDMCSNEETAEVLETSMDNYYNLHKRAKEQYLRVLRKENR